MVEATGLVTAEGTMFALNRDLRLQRLLSLGLVALRRRLELGQAHGASGARGVQRVD